MSLPVIYDAIAKRARTLEGLTECYTVTGTAQDDGTLLGIPPSMDSMPCAVLMPISGEVSPGNSEKIVHQMEMSIWQNFAEANPLGNLIFIERARVLFRTNLFANDTATRVLFLGYNALRNETMNSGSVYIVLPLRFEILETHYSSDYSLT